MRKTSHPRRRRPSHRRRERGAGGQHAGRSDRRGSSTSTRRPASDGAGLPLLGRPRRLHRRRPGPHQLDRLSRERARAARPADRRGRDAAGGGRLPGLLHARRRQPVRQLGLDRPLGRLPDHRDAGGGRGPVRLRRHRGGAASSARARAATARSCTRSTMPDVWAAAACHSGDMAFELCYLPDMPDTLRALARAEGSIETWWKKFEAAPKTPEHSFKALNILAMAAHYDPDPAAFLGLRLPVTARHLRDHPRALGELAGARPAGEGRAAVARPARAEGALHRLRRDRPVQPGLRRAAHAPATGRAAAWRTATRSSTTTTPPSTTAWTSACRSSRRRWWREYAPPLAGGERVAGEAAERPKRDGGESRLAERPPSSRFAADAARLRHFPPRAGGSVTQRRSSGSPT